MGGSVRDEVVGKGEWQEVVMRERGGCECEWEVVVRKDMQVVCRR